MMKRVLGLTLGLLLLCSPALADVSVGNGSVGIPVSCAQGGTGLSSYTIGDIPAASASCTVTKITAGVAGTVLCGAGAATLPVFCTSPAILSSNIGNACTTWTPTDQSGAGLTFTNNGSSYCVLGAKTIYVTLDITYPPTADTSVAKVSLPVANAAYRQALSLGYNGIAASFRPTASESGQYIILYANVSGGTGSQNVTFTGQRFVVSGVYQAS